MNRKAIMVNFLVTVVLAILIFGSAGAIIAKVLGVEQQAKQNFYQLHKELKEFAESGKILSGYIIILDEESFVAKFDANKATNLYLKRTYKSPTDEYFVTDSLEIDPPSQCNGKDCLVFCPHMSFDYEGGKVGCSEPPFVITLDDDFVVTPFVVARHEATGVEFRHRVIFVEGYAVTETTGYSTRRVPVNVEVYGNDDAGRKIISIGGTDGAAGAHRQWTGLTTGADSYKVDLSSDDFVVGESRNIKLVITAPEGYTINKDYPSKLKLSGNQESGLQDYTFPRSAFTFTSSTLALELPLRFDSPGQKVINAQIRFALDYSSASSPVGTFPREKDIQWTIVVSPKE
ncbi:hypothetical protein HY496_01390 [Candidatus Woesearchaeota archaeon]|nr:hypothetical protein [Candidatus Woesearchaeota archaeon]